MTLGQFIINHRKSKNLSQRQFAVLCNVSNGYIAMVEKGLNPKTKKPIIPTLLQLKKLASGMGITVSDLIEAVDDMPVVLSASSKTSSRNSAGSDNLLNRIYEFKIGIDGYSELDKTFLQKYFELPADDRETVRQMVHVMHDRRKKETQVQN